MKYSLITFRSVTPAQRGERVLQRQGYSCSLQRTPRWMQEQGCGYSIRFEDNAKKLVENTASELGIKIRAFYNEVSENNGVTYKKL